MTDLIKRINFIDPSFSTSKPDEIECVATLDSFCTSITFKKVNKVIGLKVFDHKTKSITAFSEEDFTFLNLLSVHYKKTTLRCTSPKETLIPTSVFDKANIEDYIKFNFQHLDNEVVLYDDIKGLDITHVYTINQALLNTLKRIMPLTIIRNRKSALIEQCHKHNSTKCNVYVNTKKDYFDCIAFNEKGLLFANTFFYSSAQDYIYYLMNNVKQLELNPEKLNLFLTGDIEREDETFGLVYKYIRNVNFMQKPVEIEFPFKETNYHRYFEFIQG